MQQIIRQLFFLNIFIIANFTAIHGQNSLLEGHVLEGGNRIFLPTATVTIAQEATNQLIASIATNQNGFFAIPLPVGKRYIIRTHKDGYTSKPIMLEVKFTDSGKKIYADLQMFRLSTTPQLISSEMVNAVKAYGIDTKKIMSTANPDGVNLTSLVQENDVYAEITNATRLADENYIDAYDRELMKSQPIQNNFQSPIKIDPTPPKSGPRINQDLLDSYAPKTENKIIVPESVYGETIVALAQNNPRTQSIPPNYTGYKIAFFSTLTALPATHEIFNQHGNIVLERKKNGLYTYLLGDFLEEKAATTSLIESMLDRYPTATVVALSLIHI